MAMKHKRAKPREFRLIALTNVPYNIFMNIIKEKIVQYLNVTMK